MKSSDKDKPTWRISIEEIDKPKPYIKIAVILPSRGLIFSQTADEILQNVKDIPHKFFFSHRKPLPECFEKPVNRALLDESISHLWLIEDDMIITYQTLQDMLDMDKAVVTANYPTTARKDASVLSVKGQVIYGGTGCTLVKREVFDELKAPYFRDDIAWIPKNMGDCIKFTGVKKANKGYGFHDVNFFMNLFRLGIPVHLLPYTLGQRKLKALGKAGTNEGAHDIEEWTKVKKDRYFTLIKNLKPEPKGTMTTVLADGKELMVTRSHAKTLISKGLANKMPKRAVMIDDSEIL